MALILTTTWFGTFLIDLTSGKIKKQKLFPKTVPELCVRLNTLQSQGILSEEQGMVKGLREPIMVTDERMKMLGELIEIDGVEQLPEQIILASEDFGFSPELYHQAILELGRSRTRKAVPRDHYIVQAVNGLDDLTQTANLLSERLHEWYGLYWPELDDIVKETEYVNLISKLGDRDTIIDKTENKKLKGFSALESVGAIFDPEDKETVMGFAQQLVNVHASEKSLENYIKNCMEELAPNITMLIGPIIGARLIALTGGLSRLSQVSSSTIQLLGAEKALFRHLRTGERPPKHGIIFQHPLIHNAPYWHRGKIARAFAGKLAIAAKLDYHSGKFMGDKLEEDVKRRVEEIRKKYPRPPARKGGKGKDRGKRTRRGKRKKSKR